MLRRLAGVLLLGASLLPSGFAAVATAPVLADFAVRIEPATGEFDGQGSWTVPAGVGAGTTLQVLLDERFTVQSLSVDGQPAIAAVKKQDGRQLWEITRNGRRPQRVDVQWRGRLAPLDTRLDHRTVLSHAAPVSSPRGSFLPAGIAWHPLFVGLPLRYRLQVDVPQPEYAIAAGALIEDHVKNGRHLQTYAFEQPTPSVDLIAGPYRVNERSYTSTDGRRITLRTLFHEEITELAAPYLDSAARYLALYEREIGAYAYQSFSVVSSPTPTGFGMPTMTYLGVDVLRLPFIRDTSLGHEVLHNWWGNGVYPDYSRGNWSEGLTTFMADYAYREQAGPAPAREMRLGWLRDLAALGTGEDRPLIEFTSRRHGVEQIVGYGKSAMLFLMLRDAIGVADFDRALRAFWQAHRFSVASWDDLREAFEAESHRDLKLFFTQWLTRTGAPALRLEEASCARDGASWRVDFALSQDRPAYQLRVPVTLQSGNAVDVHWVELNRERASFSVRMPGRPDAILLDPDARVLRLLSPGEAPPILRQAMLNPATLTVLASGGNVGAQLARSLIEGPLRLHSPSAGMPNEPLLLIGMRDDVQRYLRQHGLPPRPAELDLSADQASAWVWTASREDGQPLTVVSARDPKALAALERPLPHYGRQSWLVFEGDSVIARGVWPSRAQTVRLSNLGSIRSHVPPAK